ncbi:MAG: hypothetical protein J7M25_04100 [Deltaproteobacteria bacterium]|nr:hypothetical protein [Deltaproteobacteria bacterium]
MAAPLSVLIPSMTLMYFTNSGCSKKKTSKHEPVPEHLVDQGRLARVTKAVDAVLARHRSGTCASWIKATPSLSPRRHQAAAKKQQCSPLVPGRPNWNDRLVLRQAVAHARAVVGGRGIGPDVSPASRAMAIIDAIDVLEKLRHGPVSWSVSRSIATEVVALVQAFRTLIDHAHLSKSVLAGLARRLRRMGRGLPPPWLSIEGEFLARVCHAGLVGGCGGGSASKAPDKKEGVAKASRNEAGKQASGSVGSEPSGALELFRLHRPLSSSGADQRAYRDLRDLALVLAATISGQALRDCRSVTLWKSCLGRLETLNDRVGEKVGDLHRAFLAGVVSCPARLRIVEKEAPRHGKDQKPVGSGKGAASNQVAGPEAAALWTRLVSWATPFGRQDFRIVSRIGFYVAAMRLHVAIASFAARHPRRAFFSQVAGLAFSFQDPFSGNPLRVRRTRGGLDILPAASSAELGIGEHAYFVHLRSFGRSR